MKSESDGDDQVCWHQERVRCVTVLLVLLAPTAVSGVARAQAPAVQGTDGLSTSAVRQIEALLEAKAQRTPAQRKVGSQLLPALAGERPTAVPARSRVGAAPAARDQGAPSNWVEVDVHADVTAEVLGRIEALGGIIVNSVPRYGAIRARLPVGAVVPLAELDGVQFIREAVEPETWASSGTWKVNASEGDVAHQAVVARALHSVDGSGVGVGVLSNGVDSLVARQESGDLPDFVTVLPGQQGLRDEGTAMLEIVHDLAPGADLYFATATGGMAQFAANIEALCEAGADVIVDDVYYPRSEGAFQDGVIAQGINAAVANGCFYFSAAGNAGNLNDGTSGTWEGDFAAGGQFRSTGGAVLGIAHDFGGEGVGNGVTAASGVGYLLQWADPLEGSANDYDLFLVDASGREVLASSTNTQDGTQDPIEFIPGEFDVEARLVVVKADGAAERYLRLSAIAGRLAVATPGATWGHSAAENAIGVAAVDARSAGGAGGSFDGSESVETFSSDGPRRIFFEADGTPITPGDFSSTGGELLEKPDIASADNVSTSTPGFLPFRGTSAAAPHAAALAALLIEAAGGAGNVSQADLRSAMATSALDIETPGVDRDSGAGIFMAPASVRALAVEVGERNRAPIAVGTLADRSMAPDDPAVTVDLTDLFLDPDGDPLTFGSGASDPLTVAVSVSGSTLTLRPLAPGRTVVVVRAVDPHGLRGVQSFTVVVAAGTRSYDLDGDRLIEVESLAQLDAMRYDLNGNGLVDGVNWRPYYSAFPEAALGMGCPTVCAGYELTADLDFDTDGSGGPSRGDMFWNGGAGWEPVGTLGEVSIFSSGQAFVGVLRGNGHTISNLFIDRPRESGVGLFGFVWAGTLLEVGLEAANVTGQDYVGSLAGYTFDLVRVTRAYASGRVSGRNRVGGLVGGAFGFVWTNYATASVSGTGVGIGGLIGEAVFVDYSFATGRVSGRDGVGGLVGYASNRVISSFATGRVSGRGSDGLRSGCDSSGGVGGLVGHSCGAEIHENYATGPVSGRVSVGALMGSTGSGGGSVVGSYWDLDTSGFHVGVGSDDRNDNGVIDTEESRGRAFGHTTIALQAPTGPAGPYETWTPRRGGLERWDFGTSAHYPALAVDFDADGEASWREFGYQLREGPGLSAASPRGQRQVDLTWTAVDTSFWSPAPTVSYTVTRHEGDRVRTVARNLTGLEYTDRGLNVGRVYAYQVAAVVQGGEATRSALLSVKVGTPNGLPMPMGTLPDRTLREGDSPMVVDVSAGFRDPDGDALAYSASSSHADILAVSSTGASLRLDPLAVGNTTVTVTATDVRGSNSMAVQRFRVAVWPESAFDYDRDDDGLIEITSLDQLHMIRYDLDGDGRLDTSEGIPRGNPADFAEAFPRAPDGMGCGFVGGCRGFELASDLDFDTHRNGRADPGDAYWNRGRGWRPIGGIFVGFAGVFEGNGHAISNLFIGDGGLTAGLFTSTASSAAIRNLGMVDVVIGDANVAGGLVGYNGGSIVASYVVGEVTGRQSGGLVGSNFGSISRSYTKGSVSGGSPVGGLIGYDNGQVSYSYSTSQVSGRNEVGGLAGTAEGLVSASYATGRVSGSADVGGLVGRSRGGIVTASYATGRVLGSARVGGLVGSGVTGAIRASYATGRVSGRTDAGGLVGGDSGEVAFSYWDTATTGHSRGRAGEGRTTLDLQTPTGYEGIYLTWNVDVDGDVRPDEPWDFGTSAQYPVLRADIDGDGRATWQEFGYQLREGPALRTRVTDQGDVVLTWTAVDVSHWNPAPAVTYTLDGRGAGHLVFETGLRGRRYTDESLSPGRYAYRVAAVVNGGEASRSAALRVTVPDPDAPPPPPPEEEPEVRAAFDAVGVDCEGELCRALTGEPVRFLDRSVGRVRSRSWDFGDGVESREASPVHSWSEPGFYEVALRVSDGERESSATRTFLVEAGVPRGTCEADAETRCLQDSRYAIRVEWWNGAGQSGPARVVYAGTNDSGLFRFFDRNNWEILIKVLDGCAVNGRVWVYGASTTDLGHLIRVVDTVTGQVKEYRNEAGLPAPAIVDTTAFEESCRS